VRFGKLKTNNYHFYNNKMLMKTIFRFSPFLIVFVMLIWAGCAATKSSKTATPNYIGQWNYSLELPDQTIDGYLKFSQEGDEVIGVIGGDEGEMPLTNFLIDEEKASGNFEAMGYNLNMSGTFEGDVFNGKMSAEGYEFPFEANKQQ
jgi:hypothetical protein